MWEHKKNHLNPRLTNQIHIYAHITRSLNLPCRTAYDDACQLRADPTKSERSSVDLPGLDRSGLVWTGFTKSLGHFMVFFWGGRGGASLHGLAVQGK